MRNACRPIPRSFLPWFATGVTAIVLSACGGSLTPAAVTNAGAPATIQTSPDAYTFKTLNNMKDPTFNQLLGINAAGVIGGYFGSGTAGHPNKGYILRPPYKQSNYSNENYPGSKQTQVTAINDSDDTAGFWIDKRGLNRGFVRWNGVFTAISPRRSVPVP